MHRNLLLPVNFLPLDNAECAVSVTVSSSAVTDSCDKTNGSESMASLGVDVSKSRPSVSDGGLAETHEDSVS